MSLKYKLLKKLFQKDRTKFIALVKEAGLAETISALASTKFDNGWPLGMLEAFHPRLANALSAWTANGYKDMRQAQEDGNVVAGTDVFNLEKPFSLLPLWDHPIEHKSKDSTWFDRLSVGTSLELKSFMGCCADNHTFAYALNPAAVLSFTQLQSARLVGALSKENMEREVLLPKGAIFSVVSVDRSSKVIQLVQESAT